ncbi:hypothetical protein, partial [Escherichia coli]|uniref:hypothetical protein n=1 Tax=Escherichia coli TaxID=562 RepID=UPI00128EEB8B
MAFITNNGEKNLEKRLEELIEKSSEPTFMVGFFYFSGIEALYKPLKNLENNGELNEGFIKILVGLDVDEGINGLYEYGK